MVRYPSSKFVDISTCSKTELLKFLDKYGKVARSSCVPIFRVNTVIHVHIFFILMLLSNGFLKTVSTE